MGNHDGQIVGLRAADGPERVDKAWMGRAKAFEHALIRNWVLRVDGGA